MLSARNVVFIHFVPAYQLFSADDDVGDSFGQEVPPLVNLLKDILERYPEGGQILKVLIYCTRSLHACDNVFHSCDVRS